jgi:hypothetical protein
MLNKTKTLQGQKLDSLDGEIGKVKECMTVERSLIRIVSRVFLTTALSVATAAWLTPGLQANEITGSIGFGALGVDITGSDLATASSFTLSSPFITTESGAYSGVPLLTSATFNGFEFNPPVASVMPLWTFAIGGVTYSFDATSVTDSYNAKLNEWDIGGTGIAMETGYDATPGTWNVNLSQSGASIVFDSSAATTTTTEAVGVPDGGSTLLLLGGGLVCMVGFANRRKR